MCSYVCVPCGYRAWYNICRGHRRHQISRTGVKIVMSILIVLYKTTWRSIKRKMSALHYKYLTTLNLRFLETFIFFENNIGKITPFLAEVKHFCFTLNGRFKWLVTSLAMSIIYLLLKLCPDVIPNFHIALRGKYPWQRSTIGEICQKCVWVKSKNKSEFLSAVASNIQYSQTCTNDKTFWKW